MTKPQRPAPLDLTKLHTPTEVRQWKAEMADYHAALRAEEEQERLKEQTKKAHENRIILNADEAYALAVEREAQRKAREAEQEAARQAERDAKAAYLASLPAVADVSERSEFHFLQTVIHWAGKGYSLSDDGIEAFLPGFYSCRLTAPATTKKAK
jgi:hypothetical protein